MARSYRKQPVIGLCADSDAPFKVRAHRRWRRAVRVAIRCDDEMPLLREVSDLGYSPKDVKVRIADERLMRK